jgi:hypothetical protein
MQKTELEKSLDEGDKLDRDEYYKLYSNDRWRKWRTFVETRLSESDIQKDRIYRAAYACSIKMGTYIGQDGHKYAEVNGRDYVVLLDDKRVLAVYRVRPCGRLKYLKRWPAQLAPVLPTWYQPVPFLDIRQEDYELYWERGHIK